MLRVNIGGHMGDLFEAYRFIDKAMGGVSKMKSFEMPVMESMMKAFLAKRDGVKLDGDLDANYEIQMKLVKRSKPLSTEGKKALEQLRRDPEVVKVLKTIGVTKRR
jgi:hypothetical protein